MVKRKEFMLGAAVGLTFAAAATAGGVIDWPTARAETVQAGRIVPNSGVAGAAFAPPQGAPRSFADIFDQVAPAVVQIDVRARIPTPRGGGMFTIPGTPFQFPIPPGAQPPGQGQGEEDEGVVSEGSGSGFFISADGFIVTNNHVVENAEEITVRLSDERELTARLVGRDEDTDLAVLKVDGGPFPFVQFEGDAAPRVGDWVLAVGNPFGLGGSATAGIVSSTGRNLPLREGTFTDFLQIDAAINRGNSGGPTFDIYGRVVGVNTAIFTPTGGSVGVGFAIPASTAKTITDRLMRGEQIERGYLGVEIGNVLEDQRDALGLPSDFRGAYINSVTPDTPADRAGLRPGDIVTAVDGRAVDGSTEVTRAVAAKRPGETLRLEVLREGRRQTVEVRVGLRPRNLGAETGPAPSVEEPTPEAPAGETVVGLRVAPVSATLRQRYDLPANVGGLVITSVEPQSTAARIGFEPGMVILQANQRPVASAADLRAVVQAARAANRTGVLLLVRTSQGNRPVVLELPDAE
ncbi:Do family serine endopeptidase [Brevundimonas balnearis]|uniref:Do family serine endopeptidase n=1 Tax=Brevundimonas balnearis TaxID=1572858 RepID=A0ABV6R1C3_9CAUL